ncbi:hypothetical protein B7463_g7294, partial [Scytalidium lignicola]
MVAMYTIAGQKIGSHWLSMATLASTFGLAYWGLSGPSKKQTQTPPIKAQSADEESFIKEFLKNAEVEEQKAKH